MYDILYTFLNKNRKYVLISIDTLIAILTYLLPFVMSGMYSDSVASIKFGFFLEHFWLYTIIYILTFVFFGVYNSMWRYAGIEDVFLCLKAAIVANLIFLSITLFFGMNVRYYVYFVVFPVSSFCSMGIRIVYRAFLIINSKDDIKSDNHINVMIIGAGEATVAILNEIKLNNPKKYKIRCIIDDDKSKIGRNINTIPIVADTNKIVEMCKKYNIQEIILCIPSIDKKNKKRILDICSKTKCKLKIIPELYSLLSNDA